METRTSRRTHSKVIAGKRHIWNVEDLWRQAEHLPVEERDPHSVIDLENDGWFGGKMPNAGMILDHMRRILEADLTFPIILDNDDSIMDGAHRACRAILENRATVKVVRFDRTPEPSCVQKL